MTNLSTRDVLLLLLLVVLVMIVIITQSWIIYELVVRGQVPVVAIATAGDVIAVVT